MGQIRTFINIIRRYLGQYGGWKGVIFSPFFIGAAAITAVSYNSWLTGQWAETAQSLIPSLLGFSLGTYAILFSIMTGRLKRALRAVLNPQGIPYLFEMNATFLHFIFIQVVALLWAFLYDGTAFADLVRWIADPTVSHIFQWVKVFGSFIGFLLLVYSFLLTIAAALVVYRLAAINDPQAD